MAQISSYATVKDPSKTYQPIPLVLCTL